MMEKMAVILPGDVDSHIFLCGTGENPKQLIKGGGQEVDHHMALHGMQTLRVEHQRDVFI